MATRNIFALDSIDRSVNLSVNCFNGRMYFSIFKQESNVPVSIWVSMNVKHFLIKFIRKLIKSPEPNQRYSVLISTYNKDTKTFDESAVISIRTDEQRFIEMVISSVSAYNNKVDADMLGTEHVFRFSVPPSIELGHQPMNDQQRNLEGAEIFVDMLEKYSTVFEAASNRDQPQQTHTQPKPMQQKPQVTDDIPF